MAMVLTMNAIADGAEAEMPLCGPAGDIAPECVGIGDSQSTTKRGQLSRVDEDDDDVPKAAQGLIVRALSARQRCGHFNFD
jgi:hypothetical protein